jgi:hypothetical protein
MQVIARDELLEVLKTLGDDDNTAAIALALATGDPPADQKSIWPYRDRL